MSDARRRAWRAVAALALVLPCARLASAQVAVATRGAPAVAAGIAQPSLESVRRDLANAIRAGDSSVRMLDARLMALDRAANRLASDTVRLGPAVVATTPDLMPMARAALATALPAARARWGDAALAGAFAGAVVRVMPVATSGLGGRRTALEADITIARRSVRHAKLGEFGDDSVAALARYLEHNASELIGERSASDLTLWMLGGRLSDPAVNFTEAFVDLFTAPALVARECAERDPARCRVALGLALVDDPPGTMYTEEDRRVVARAWWGRRYATAEHPVNPCASAPMTAACRTFAQSLAPEAWTRPLGRSARMAVLAVATEMGGAGAWGRLVADSTVPLAARIELAAGRPIGDVVSAWRSRVLASRPEPVRPSLRQFAVLASLLVAGLSAALVTRGRA